MELFASNQQVAELESALATRQGTARPTLLVHLAWQLRQRDCTRALRLADEAEALLDTAGIDAAEQQRSQARLHLVRGEVDWLFGKLDAAANHADVAIQIFERLGDRIGAGDGHWLQASIWMERGNATRRDECLGLAIENYRNGDDQVRIATSLARSLHYAVFHDTVAAATRLAQLFDQTSRRATQTTGWLTSAQAILASLTGDPGTAIKLFMQAYHAAQDCGQLRHAIVTASNIADTFATLGDLDTALEWNERSLSQARGAGWPATIGVCLYQTGNVLRLLDRPASAGETLCEALTLLARLTGTKSYTVALLYLGDLSLDVGEPAAALAYFQQAEDQSLALKEPGLIMRCRRGQANALCRLDQPALARDKLSAALTLATEKGNADEQVKLLRVYAELFHQFDLPPPVGMTAPSATLHYLNQALAVAATISGYTLPGELLDELAIAYAACGDYRQAYANGQAASAARDSKRLEQARNRAIAMQVHQATERAHAESERHRLLAETEAKRATDLQAASATLETLGLIGREITASLNANAVFATLYRHVNRLLDATSIAVYLLEDEGQVLRCEFGIEDGQPFQLISIRIDNPTSLSARCARERCDVVIDVTPEMPRSSVISGTLETQSLLFSPLLIGERLLGVMSIQSIHAHAYGERERSIFRTLCAYGAIALDNASAYALAEASRHQADRALTELRDTQAQLVQSEKMASLGALVAGVAHEINTPLGVCVTATSHLEEELRLVLAERAQGPLSEPSLAQLLDEAVDTVRILKSNTQRAARLIHGFKQVSVDQASGEMRTLNLAEYLNEVLLTLGPSLKNKPISIDVACPPNLVMHTFPGALAQVMTNLIMNSMIHGFEGKAHGAIRIAITRDGDSVQLRYADDGQGMEAEALNKLFDPFFTTTRGSGGSGLGAHIVYNLVTGPLAGRIQASSTPGQGLQYDIRMPIKLAVPFSE